MDESHHLMGVWSQLQAAVPLRGVERRTAELSSYLLPARIVTHLSREFKWKATRVHLVQPHLHSSVIGDSNQLLIQYLASLNAHVYLLYVHEQTQMGPQPCMHNCNHSHTKSSQLLPHNHQPPHIFSMHIHSSSPNF